MHHIFFLLKWKYSDTTLETFFLLLLEEAEWLYQDWRGKFKQNNP